MKVLLVFPPQWIPYRPYLSLPSLAAYLQEKGIDVVQKDLNVEAYDLMLSERYLLSLQDRLEHNFSIKDSQERLSSVLEQKYYNDLFMAKSTVESIAGKVEKAKRALRDKVDFYNVDTVTGANKIIEQALAIISIAHFPTQVSLSSLDFPVFDGTVKGIEDLTANGDQNPLLALFNDNLLASVIEEGADVIGISITGHSQLIPALTLSRMIKANAPKTHVVIGGNIVSLLADSIKKHGELFGRFFDSAIVLEGERPMAILAEHLRNGQALDDVTNLIWFDRQRVRSNEVAIAEGINSLPTPNFDGLPLDLYLSPEPVLPLLASRGCYWTKCAFCSQNFGFGECYHSRDPHKVLEDMQKLAQKHGTKYFAFSDEAISPNMMNKLSGEILGSGLKVCCSTNVRMETQFTPELCRKIFSAGFKLLYLGLESGTDRVLRLMNKGITTEQAAAACRNMYEAGIWDHLYVMFGFPGETKEEAQETIDFLLAHKDIIHSFHVDNFSLERGMALERHPKQYGVIIEESKTRDFKITFDFKVESGLSYDEAHALAVEAMDTVGRQFEGNEILGKLTHYYLPLYLLHYENADPFLKTVIHQKSAIRIIPERQLNRRSVPRVKQGLVVEQINFNLLAIRQSFTAGAQAQAVNREPTMIVFDPDPEANKMSSVPEQASEILVLCDGKHNVKEIASGLAQKYDAPAERIEVDVLALLQPLAKNGYVIV